MSSDAQKKIVCSARLQRSHSVQATRSGGEALRLGYVRGFPPAPEEVMSMRHHEAGWSVQCPLVTVREPSFLHEAEVLCQVTHTHGPNASEARRGCSLGSVPDGSAPLHPFQLGRSVRSDASAARGI